jgi:hypothetical protein
VGGGAQQTCWHAAMYGGDAAAAGCNTSPVRSCLMFIPWAPYLKASSTGVTGCCWLQLRKLTTVKTAISLHHSDYFWYICYPLLISSGWHISFREHHSKKLICKVFVCCKFDSVYHPHGVLFFCSIDL